MSGKIKAVLITGLFGVVAAVVTGLFSYNAGSVSASVAATNSNHLTISINGETVSVRPEEYRNMYENMELTNSQLVEENIALKDENSRLKKKLESTDVPGQTSSPEDLIFMPDTAPAYESYHYKEYSQRSSEAATFYIAGKKYYNGMVWNAWNTGYSLHSLDGKYVEITGVLGHIDKSDMGESSLQIYFDGGLHKEVALSAEMVAQPFSINVTGVNQLKLMVSHGRGSYGYADVTIR